MKSVVLVLNTIHGVNVFMNGSRDERLGCRPEVREKTVDDEGGGETPDIEHVIDVFCTTDRVLEGGVDLCCPVMFISYTCRSVDFG